VRAGAVFILRIENEKPLRSFIQSLETPWLEPAGHSRFEIRASDSRGPRSALVLPDIAISRIVSVKSSILVIDVTFIRSRIVRNAVRASASSRPCL
jgi:hypothetical protein